MAARSTNADPIPLETKSPPSSPWEKQSPSTNKSPQSQLFNCKGPLAKNHVKKMPQGKLFRGRIPTDHVPRTGTRRSLRGPSRVLLPWRLQSQLHCPPRPALFPAAVTTAPGTFPAAQPRRRDQNVETEQAAFARYSATNAWGALQLAPAARRWARAFC